MILITRPEPEASILKNKLSKFNIDSTIEPIMKVKYHDNIIKQIKNFEYDSVIITSKNALITIKDVINPNIALNIVGEESAKIAESYGFSNIINIAENIEKLVKIIKNTYKFNSKFLYMRGKIISADLQLLLSNFIIHDVICYEAIPIIKMSNETTDLIRNHSIKTILFFSKQTSIYFLNLIKNENMNSYLKNIKAIAISESVGNILMNSEWEKVIISSYPSENNMIALVKETMDGRKTNN